MKAAVISAPNTEVRIHERDRPSPSRGEVLIRVRACGVCHGDLMLQQGQFPFARYPVVPGHEVAGVIEEVGKDVDKVQPATASVSRHFSHRAAAASNASTVTSFFVRKCNLPVLPKTAGISSSCLHLPLMLRLSQIT
jgi:NADPH:quinone reductase-like Zn-dependent oxidoreductase